MKKILLCLLCGVMLFSITGCGNEKYNNTNKTNVEESEKSEDKD